jgi:hypothetical protein
MAKRRRKPNQRQRPSSAAGGGVRTAGSRHDAPSGSRDGEAHPGVKAVRERPAATPGHVARAEKKEMARRQREEVRRRVRRAERMRRLTWFAGGAVVLAAGVLWFARDTTPPERPNVLPGELTTTSIPWPANAEEAAERADLIGLPGHEGTLAMHEHANVRIFVHGEETSIPIDVGIDRTEQPAAIASVHTHSGDGVVHIESNSLAEFTLGQFFDVWGIRLSGTCLGGFCEQGDDALRVFVGGQEVTTGIRGVSLEDQAVIVVTFGTEDELPEPIPSTFDFTTVQP